MPTFGSSTGRTSLSPTRRASACRSAATSRARDHPGNHVSGTSKREITVRVIVEPPLPQATNQQSESSRLCSLHKRTQTSCRPSPGRFSSRHDPAERASTLTMSNKKSTLAHEVWFLEILDEAAKHFPAALSHNHHRWPCRRGSRSSDPNSSSRPRRFQGADCRRTSTGPWP